MGQKPMYQAVNNSPQTMLAGGISAGAGVIEVMDGGVLPQGPNIATIGTDDIFARCGEAVGLAPDTSVAVLVTGPRRSFIEIQRALGRFEVEVNKVAVVIDPAEKVGVKRAAGLTILVIGELADLRRVVLGGVVA